MNSFFRFNILKIKCFTTKLSFYAALFSCLISTVYAGGGQVQCNAIPNSSEVANSGQPITQFNGYDRWDSMFELVNGQGRTERFWLDNNGDGSGKIRHTYASSRCSGFHWEPHKDFGNHAQEMVLARDDKMRLVLAQIGKDKAFYWKYQTSKGGGWTEWYKLNEPRSFSGGLTVRRDSNNRDSVLVFTARGSDAVYEIGLLSATRNSAKACERSTFSKLSIYRLYGEDDLIANCVPIYDGDPSN